MLKSLMLAVACAYINPPGLQPNAPVVQATVPEILKQAYAMEPGTQKEVILDHGDNLCSKIVIEPSDDKALEPFVNWQAWEIVIPLPRPRPVEAPKSAAADCPAEEDAACREGEAAPIGLVGTLWPPGSEHVETTAGK
jgi:hypothetical protein